MPTPDPKPPRRVVDPEAGLTKVARERACRICGNDWRVTPWRMYGLTRHHLVKRSQGGDDVDANIVPLCGHGTIGCHGLVESGHRASRVRLRATLQPAELAYAAKKKSLAWLDRQYPCK